MDRRRRIAVIATFVTVLAVCAIAVPLARGQATPARERGELTQLVQNTAAHQGTSRTRLATDHDHMAVISAQAVTYFDQTDAQYRTDITTQFEVTDLFDRGGFTNYRVDAAATTGALLGEVLPILLFALIAGLVFRQLRGGGMIGGIGKSRARTINPGEMSGVTFADVAGADEAVAELSEVVNILRNPDRYAELGARIPRGVMLVGPPGTGKTLLAKAVAGEAGVPFFSVSGSAFVEMFVGVGASRIRDLFAEARKRGSAIIFIDEIDAVGRRRGANGGHSNDEREQTLNQLLVEMDGFDTTTPVIVMAASNRADVLDPALLRPGRFDRCVVVDTPDIIGRAAILGVHSRGKPLSTGVDLAVIARQTPGFSGAELANIINEAALLTARAERKVIEMPDLEEACLRVQAGPERANRLLSDGELRVIAYHEMGHALVGHTLEHSDPVHRISIVSRGRALGWTMQLPERDQVLSSRAQMTDRLAGLLGGRVSEEMIFGGDMITSGAADDIERATALARRMVTELGMSPLGPRAFLAADPGSPRTYSEEVAAAVDVEVDRLLEEAEMRARAVLLARRGALDALAGQLLSVETMDAPHMLAILGDHPAPAIPSTRISPRRRGQAPPGAPAVIPGAAEGHTAHQVPEREAMAAAVGVRVQDREVPRQGHRTGLRRTFALCLRAAGLAGR